jgi:hypothetical protein
MNRVKIVNSTNDVIKLILKGLEGNKSITIKPKELYNMENKKSFELEKEAKVLVKNKGILTRNIKHKYKKEIYINNDAKKIIIKKLY